MIPAASLSTNDRQLLFPANFWRIQNTQLIVRSSSIEYRIIYKFDYMYTKEDWETDNERTLISMNIVKYIHQVFWWLERYTIIQEKRKKHEYLVERWRLCRDVGVVASTFTLSTFSLSSSAFSYAYLWNTRNLSCFANKKIIVRPSRI